MAHDVYNLEELADQLGRDRREIEKLASRGRIPGRKVGGDWQFHPLEITQWLEQEMREYTDRELADLERSQASAEVDDLPVSVLLSPETIAIPLQGRTRRSVLESLVEVAGRTWHVWEPAAILAAIREREELQSTAFEGGVAIPHPRNPLPDKLGQSVVAFGRTPTSIPFGGSGGGMVDLFFLVLCRDPRTHLKLLARLARMLRLPGFLDELRAVGDANTAYEIVKQYDETVGEQRT